VLVFTVPFYCKVCNVSGKAGAWHSHLVMVAWNISLIQVHVLWQSVWEGFELFWH